MENEKYARDNTSKNSKTSLSKVVLALMLTMNVATIGGVQHLHDIKPSKSSFDFFFPL